MTDVSKLIEDLRAGLEGVTPGEWRVGPVDDTIVTAADGSEVAQIDGDYNEPDLWPIMEANAAHIARCSPDNIAALLNHVAALEAENTRLCARAEAAEGAVRVVQNAARTLDAMRSAEIANLQKATKIETTAVATLDSEREANAILTDRLEALEAENKALRENREQLERALCWYGENARLCKLIHSEGDLGRNNLDADGGSRARAALGAP